MGHDRHAHRCCDILARSVCSTLLPGLYGKRYTDRFHVYCEWLLHATRASASAKLVVFIDWRVDNYWRCLELWVRPDYWWIFGSLAVHLPSGRLTHHHLRCCMLCRPQLGSVRVVPVCRGTCCRSRKAEKRSNGCTMSEIERIPDPRSSVRCQDMARGIHDGCCVRPFLFRWLEVLKYIQRYTVNGAVSGFGPLIVSTFGYVLFQLVLLIEVSYLIETTIAGRRSTRYYFNSLWEASVSSSSYSQDTSPVAYRTSASCCWYFAASLSSLAVP